MKFIFFRETQSYEQQYLHTLTNHKSKLSFYIYLSFQDVKLDLNV
jgi:hypothetical protein